MVKEVKEAIISLDTHRLRKSFLNNNISFVCRDGFDRLKNVPGVIFVLTYRFNFDRLEGGDVCEFNAQYIADRKGKGEGDSVIGKSKNS